MVKAEQSNITCKKTMKMKRGCLNSLNENLVKNFKIIKKL